MQKVKPLADAAGFDRIKVISQPCWREDGSWLGWDFGIAASKDGRIHATRQMFPSEGDWERVNVAEAVRLLSEFFSTAEPSPESDAFNSSP